MKGDPEMCVESVLTGVFTCRENSIISCSVPQVGSPRWVLHDGQQCVQSWPSLTDWPMIESFQPWPCWHLWHKSRESGSHLWRLVEDLQHVGAHTEGSERRQNVEAEYSVLCPPGCWQHAWRTEHMTEATAPFNVIVLLLFHLTSECSIIRSVLWRIVAWSSKWWSPPCTDKRVFAAQRDGERRGKPSITELGSKRVENTPKQRCEWTCEGNTSWRLTVPPEAVTSSSWLLNGIFHSKTFRHQTLCFLLYKESCDLLGFKRIWDNKFWLRQVLFFRGKTLLSCCFGSFNFPMRTSVSGFKLLTCIRDLKLHK